MAPLPLHHTHPQPVPQRSGELHTTLHLQVQACTSSLNHHPLLHLTSSTLHHHLTSCTSVTTPLPAPRSLARSAGRWAALYSSPTTPLQGPYHPQTLMDGPIFPLKDCGVQT